MVDTNTLPTLDLEVGTPGSVKHTPIIAGQVFAGIGLGIIIAVTD